MGCISLKGTIAAPNASVCLSRAFRCVCMQCVVSFAWLRPVRLHVRPSLRGGRGPHARAVRGRWITSTKVRALPESLGQCKLLEELCVPRPPPPPLFAFAAVPALRCGAWRCRTGALGRTARRWMRRRWRCRLPAAADPAHAWLAPAADRRAVQGGPEPPGAAARWARRYAHNSELAALPAAADWPNLKIL